MEGYQPRAEHLLPELQHWSDITFIDYAKLLQISPAPNTLGLSNPIGHPKWIMARGISRSIEALKLISYCVKTYTGETKIPDWPGTTFPIGTYCYNALMGINIGKAIGAFLVTHKQRYAVRKSLDSLLTVDSITIFTMPEDVEEDVQRPSLLFHIRQVSAIKDIYTTHSRAGLETPGSGIGKQFPFPMEPVMADSMTSNDPQAGSSRQGQ